MIAVRAKGPGRIHHVIGRQAGLCAYCLRPSDWVYRRHNPLPNSPTLDHVVAKSKGGGNHHHNMVMACYECNQTKGNLGDYSGKRFTKAEAMAALESEGAEAVRLAETWLSELEDSLWRVRCGTRCPRAKSRRLTRVYRYWERHMLDADGLSGPWRSAVSRCGLCTLNSAQIACWTPKVAVSV